MKNLNLFLLIGLLAFASCGDDATTPKEESETTAQKVQHRWTLVSVIDYNYVDSSTTLDYIDTIIGSNPANYVEFRADNTASAQIDGDTETFSYSILSDNMIVFDGDDFVITTLNANTFIMTYADREDIPYYDNVITMKR